MIEQIWQQASRDLNTERRKFNNKNNVIYYITIICLDNSLKTSLVSLDRNTNTYVR